MRIFVFVAVLIPAFSGPTFAQIKNPYADVLQRPTTIAVNDNDSQQTTLLKRSFNAAHNEMRIRYNYWLQGVGEIGGLLSAIERFHQTRLEVGPAASEIAFVEQKLTFARRIETQCKKEKSKARKESLRAIDEASAIAFRIRTEQMVFKLKSVAGSLPVKDRVESGQ